MPLCLTLRECDLHILVNAVGARMGGAARHLQPFLRALLTVRPDWHLVVCVAQGDEDALGSRDHQYLDSRLDLLTTAGQDLVSRLGWDIHGAAALAKRHNVDAILNLTNYGPMRPDRPSVLFQRNPIYFDPFWIRRAGVRHRTVAAARRRLAYAELARSSVVVAPTHAMLSYLRAWPDASLPLRTAVINHSVDAERFAFVEPRLRPHDDSVRLLTVAHAAPHKGLETAVSCVARLRRLGITAELSLTISKTGNGPSQGYVDSLLRLARRQNVDTQIEWIGTQSSAERLYHESDVLLFPSLTESFGFPLVEALASGTPIVASAIPSSIEVAADKACYFVPADAATAAAQIITVLQRNHAAAAVLAAKGRALAETMTWERNASAVALMLEQVSA